MLILMMTYMKGMCDADEWLMVPFIVAEVSLAVFRAANQAKLKSIPDHTQAVLRRGNRVRLDPSHSAALQPHHTHSFARRG